MLSKTCRFHRLILALSCAMALPLHAQTPKPASGWSYEGNVALTSNYVSRGFTQSWGRPAVQGGYDVSHDNGFYAGTWASSLSGAEFNGGTVEWDVYAGHAGELGKGVGYTVGAAYYHYPGTSSPWIDGRRYDYAEVSVGLNWSVLSAQYHHVVTNDWFGTVDNGRGSGYLEVNAGIPLAERTTLDLHAGRGTVKRNSEANWTDYKIGVTQMLGDGWSVSGALSRANDRDGYWTATSFSNPGQTRALGKTAFSATVKKTF